jgi:hypothetical protein
MTTELACAAHGAAVGKTSLRQNELFTLDGGRTLVLCSAVGMPRLWGYALDAAVAGFLAGFERPHDGRASTRMAQGVEAARSALRTRVDALIERRIPDVMLLALSMHAARLDVVSVGPCRAYLRRGGDTRRLTPKDDLARGLLGGSAAFCSEQLHEGDLLLGGSRGGFVEASLAALGQLLTASPHASAQEVVATLNTPAVSARLGVATFALRL